MDQTTWGALAFVLTILAGGYTWWAFRHRGAQAGLRGAAVTLLPPAAYLTGTLRMFTRILNAVVDWLTNLVFSPSVWIGSILLFVAVVLFGVAGRLGGRTGGRAGGRAAGRDAARGGSGGASAAPQASTGRASGAGALGASPVRKGKPVIDDDLAEIEALLRKRGIS